METAELAKLVFSRVQQVDPDNVSKIVGCILLREPDEDDMVQLAYGSDAALLATIVDAKATLAAIYARCSSVHYQAAAGGGGYQQLCSHPAGLRHFSPAAFNFHVQSQYWPADSPPPPAPAAAEKAQQEYKFVDAAAESHYAPRGQHGLDDHLDAVEGYYYAEDAFVHNGAGPRATSRRPNGVSSRRSCHYFFKGICKNGQNCHYSHHQVYSDGFAVDHHLQGGTTPGSLERLELEITELLHSRRGQPVSIASLPTLYGEKYGKGLQADGYLTESQRHGKAGYSLTKLLSRLNKIRVIERPHGQHSVVLAEDAAKYTDCRSDRGGGNMPASSHQIYLTFPSDSTFSEEDVATYFGQFGPVRDVRIPCQDQRMFGFVSFQNPETVTALLMRRNPHFICGSRVLAKPYREKSKCINERTKSVPLMQYYPPRWFETDPEFYPEYDSPRLARKQLMEKRERLFELERRRLAGLRIEPLPPQFAYFDCSIGDVGPFNSLSAGSKKLGLTDPLVTPDPLEIVSTSQAPPTQASNNYDDQESNQIELLPESPFASSAPAGNSI